MFLQNRKRINLTIEEKKWIVQHAEENKKMSRVKIALDFSTKFNRSITAQCVTKTIAKKAEISRTIQAMAQTNNLNLRNIDSHICSQSHPLRLMKPVGYYLDSLKLRLFFDIFA